MKRRPARLGAVVLALLVLLVACTDDGTSPEPSVDSSAAVAASQDAARRARECADTTQAMLDATQRYVDSYGTPLEEDSATPAPSEEPLEGGDFQAAMDRAQRTIRRLGCDPEQLRADLENGLAGITARGALARAVLLQLEASMTGGLSPVPETRRLSPGEDLPRALAALAAGSTVELGPGSYRLRQSLVLLQGVTIRGSGRGRTTIRSVAPDVALLVLTDRRVELASLTLRHTGDAPASVLMGGPLSSVVLTGVRVTGARSGSDGGQGLGAGVLMSARAGEAGDRGTTLEVTNSDFVGNAAAGVVLAGGHRASIVGSTFRDNGQCGVCFVGASSGAVRNSTFKANGAGVAVVERARPLLAGDTFIGGQVGVQASGRATPVVRNATVSAPARAAMIFTDRSAGRVEGSSCRDAKFGIVVSPDALPYLGDNDCTVVPGR